MKQRITEEQYNEIQEELKETWYRFALEKGYTLVDEYPMWADSEGWDVERPQLLGFPGIGEMIEFLSEHEYDGDDKDFSFEKNHITAYYSGELRDALWKAVKEILTKSS